MSNLDAITHTAHHDHLCAFCGMTVRTGERYVRTQSLGGAQAKKPFHSKWYQGLAATNVERSTNLVIEEKRWTELNDSCGCQL